MTPALTRASATPVPMPRLMRRLTAAADAPVDAFDGGSSSDGG